MMIVIFVFSSLLPRCGFCTLNLRSGRRTCRPPERPWSDTEQALHSDVKMNSAMSNADCNRRFFSGQGTAIGKCPKNKLLKGYIELELQLREFDRCRKLYEKYLEFSPENCTTWIKFAELETILGDADRARAIFELAIGQPRLDMPEVMSLLRGLLPECCYSDLGHLRIGNKRRPTLGSVFSRSCGSPTSTLRLSRKSMTTPGISTNGCCSALNM